MATARWASICSGPYICRTSPARAMVGQGVEESSHLFSRRLSRRAPPLRRMRRARQLEYVQSVYGHGAGELRRSYVVVAPGWVSTERVAESIENPAVLAEQPLGRVATPEEVAQVATILRTIERRPACRAPSRRERRVLFAELASTPSSCEVESRHWLSDQVVWVQVLLRPLTSLSRMHHLSQPSKFHAS